MNSKRNVMDRASRKTLLFLKTTFSGVTVKVSLSVAKFDRFEDLGTGYGLSGLSY